MGRIPYTTTTGFRGVTGTKGSMPRHMEGAWEGSKRSPDARKAEQSALMPALDSGDRRAVQRSEMELHGVSPTGEKDDAFLIREPSEHVIQWGFGDLDGMKHYQLCSESQSLQVLSLAMHTQFNNPDSHVSRPLSGAYTTACRDVGIMTRTRNLRTHASRNTKGALPLEGCWPCNCRCVPLRCTLPTLHSTTGYHLMASLGIEDTHRRPGLRDRIRCDRPCS